MIDIAAAATTRNTRSTVDYLTTTHEVLESIIDQINDGIVIASPEGKISYYNNMVRELFGLSSESPVENLKDLCGINWSRRLARAAIDAGGDYGTLVASDRTIHFEEKIHAGDSIRFLEFTIKRLFSHSRHHEVRVIVVRDVSARRRLEATLQSGGACGLISNSPEMLKVFEKARQVASSDASIMLQGESGTGKSCVARLIHEQSSRNRYPLIEVNCAAVPSTLLESEFFGHTKGAFTGAHDQRQGKFQAADHGTLLLDEIGELPLHLQAKILHAIEDRRFQMLGSNETLNVNFRLVSASNINLREAIDSNLFRADLYYRISVIPITIPPLRERISDVPLLVNHFCDDLVARGHKDNIKITKAAWQALLNYPWPGNIRELNNAVEHGVICSDNGVVDVDSLPQDIQRFGRSASVVVTLQVPETSPDKSAEENAQIIQKFELQDAMEKAHGSKTVAAQILGIDRSTLWRRMQKAGLA
ncbi:MAG: sigma 54-interacting transcriptional regulator [Parasulfuritortus sp.]|jgi:PAS domain S-box-containing protein|nr:sigma 54-interacting transcriptional regulator [Parasulfuritortus sp.]